jgi:broad specificity phosphatase PhoE
MRAIVVRHYKTLFNSAGRIMGWQDAPRVKDWHADVAFVEARLREREVSIDAIYCSDLERARQTAMHYGRSLAIPVIHDSWALNEVDYGALSSKSKRWVQQHVPEHKRDPDYVYPDGESFRQMQERSTGLIRSLTDHMDGKTILVVVHAGVIRGLVSYFLELDYARQLKRRVSHRYIGVFQFENSHCCGYDEWGKPSGFVREPDGLQLPWRRATTSPRSAIVPQRSTGQIPER